MSIFDFTISLLERIAARHNRRACASALRCFIENGALFEFPFTVILGKADAYYAANAAGRAAHWYHNHDDLLLLSLFDGLVPQAENYPEMYAAMQTVFTVLASQARSKGAPAKHNLEIEIRMIYRSVITTRIRQICNSTECKNKVAENHLFTVSAIISHLCYNRLYSGCPRAEDAREWLYGMFLEVDDRRFFDVLAMFVPENYTLAFAGVIPIFSLSDVPGTRKHPYSAACGMKKTRCTVEESDAFDYLTGNVIAFWLMQIRQSQARLAAESDAQRALAAIRS